VFAARANALLGGRGARVIALFAAQEYVFELVHARVREEQRGVMGRDKRRRGQHAVGAGGKELQKSGSDFAGFHIRITIHHSLFET
jgi:hypothetical protein